MYVDPSLSVFLFAHVYVYAYICLFILCDYMYKCLYENYLVFLCVCVCMHACVSTFLCVDVHVCIGETRLFLSEMLAPQIEAETPKKSCLCLGQRLPCDWCSSMPLSLFCPCLPSS